MCSYSLAAEAVGGDPKLRSTNQEVAQLLEQVAALGEDTGEADLTPPSGPAPNRFAAAVLAYGGCWQCQSC